MTGADQVLALAGVDPGLAADRAVDLSQQGGGDLDEVEAAQRDCRGQSGQVADDPAAQRHQQGPAVDPGVEQVTGQPLEMGEVLGRLAGRQHDLAVAEARLVEGGEQRLEMQAGDGLVGHHDQPPVRQDLLDLRAGLGDQSRTDPDRVGTLAQGYGQAFDRVHALALSDCGTGGVVPRCRSRASRTRWTVASGGPSRLSTMMSASA